MNERVVYPMRFTALVRAAVAGLLLLGSLSCENLDRYGPNGSASVPTAPTGLVAVPASSSEIALTWSSPAGATGTITYRLFRGGAEVGTTDGTAYMDHGLTASTTYIYTVTAFDQFGSVSPASNPASATTLDNGQTDSGPPSVPTGLVAVAGSSTTISLSWSPSTDDVGVLGYRIFRGGVQVGLSAAAQYTDQGLTPSTAYTYTVAALDGAGNVSAQSSPASATTLDVGQTDNQAPSTPSGLNAVASSSSSISLTWNPSTDDLGVLGYRIYRGGTEVGTVSGTTYSDEGLSPSTQYSYTVAAYDAAGNLSGQSNPASATTLSSGQSDTEPPTVPSLVVAVASGSDAVTVTWEASTDNIGVLGYRVFRDGVEVGTTSGQLYSDDGLAPSTTYTYTVAAFDAAGNESAQSAGDDATTLGGGVTDTQPPSVPTGLVVTLATSVSITLSWNPSTDNVGVSGYIIYRDGVQIATSVATTFTDLALCAATGFVYTVAAFDAAGNVSAQSAPVNGSTLNVLVNLGSAGNFTVLAGAGISLTGLLPSLVTGNVGSSPSNSIIGQLLLTLLGGGVLHLGDGVAATAQVDLNAALGDLLAQPVCAANNLPGSNLSGLTLHAGVYAVPAAATLNASTTLTLDAEGDPNAVFVIKVNGGLNIGNNAQVVLINGAQASNVHWRVAGTATVGAGANVKGNLLATSSINLGLAANLQGRALSRNGTVSMLVSVLGL